MWGDKEEEPKRTQWQRSNGLAVCWKTGRRDLGKWFYRKTMGSDIEFQVEMYCRWLCVCVWDHSYVCIIQNDAYNFIVDPHCLWIRFIGLTSTLDTLLIIRRREERHFTNESITSFSFGNKSPNPNKRKGIYLHLDDLPGAWRGTGTRSSFICYFNSLRSSQQRISSGKDRRQRGWRVILFTVLSESRSSRDTAGILESLNFLPLKSLRITQSKF